jgi:hypothetical protein
MWLMLQAGTKLSVLAKRATERLAYCSGTGMIDFIDGFAALDLACSMLQDPAFDGQNKIQKLEDRVAGNRSGFAKCAVNVYLALACRIK